MYIKYRIILLISFLNFSNYIYSQLIDSVQIKPYSNIDSIQYWHSAEQRNVNQYYVKNGYNIYYSCYYHNFLKQYNYKSNQTIILSEGLIENNYKQGNWIYWHDIKSKCCDEIQLYPDSSITFNNGKRIKKIDLLATYLYFGSDSLTIHPFYDNNATIKHKIICQNSLCKIIINEKYVFKEFSIENIEQELNNIHNGLYNAESRKIIDITTK